MANSQASLYKLLSKHSSNQQVAAGEEIFNYGDAADKVYLIHRGLVGIFIEEDGEEKEVDRVKSGQIFGEVALLEQEDRSCRALAHKDTVLIIFAPEDMRKLVQEQPFLNKQLVTSLCQRIKHLQNSAIDFPEIKIDAEAEEIDVEKDSTEEDAIEEVKPEQDDKEPVEGATDFYLPGHGKYPQVAEADFDNYLYTKEVQCPVCTAEIEVKKVRNSRLRLQEIREDLRPVYKNFEPDWYKIWICTECFYTARKADFLNFEARQLKKIKTEFKDKVQTMLGADYQPSYSEPRKLSEVFTAYYLSIQLYRLIEARADKLGYLWLRLSWLYEDVEAEELSAEASFKALKYFKNFHFGPDASSISTSQENKLTILLAMLYYKHDEPKEAVTLLSKLVHNPKTKRAHKKMAKERFLKIRKELRAKKEG
ncbi:DUF2225 domain-containing protein [Fuchsiella alkaliacetigena]|uniref:DUF2225 domain-containing protein n=1 Tax=Fuchsiella alkaliacetigena TaxID=957042 RepID=UPI00200B722D|nr:DUF2225 domain-containing protein [Fuchsiella alkaliacetigena]MCK8825772.1 DUF2225 domain-containing protein [Fuchsiella alkaliacetigena]